MGQAKTFQGILAVGSTVGHGISHARANAGQRTYSGANKVGDGMRAQQPDRVRRIGVLMTIAANDPEAQARLATFQARLEQLGWTDRRNVQIDTRFGEGDADHIRKSAVELVELAPDVILASTSAALAPLRAAVCGTSRTWPDLRGAG
jgi:nucleotide-binding universal stress UspA family protein